MQDTVLLDNLADVLSVTALNRQIRLLLESQVGEIFVQGELSNLSQPASGHCYFTLKDKNAQIRCVFFRNRHVKTQLLQNGQQLIARGTLSVYEPRGDYQLIVAELNEAGLGDLHKLFELLKVKLQALGLFEASRKKPLPRFPSCIGVISSSTGAALRDILTTLNRRFPQALVLVYPSDVQGKAASGQLIQALSRANQDGRADVLIMARGGGSIEDLWAFNDETLAHAMAKSEIPIVTGIGHETDFTIADFVADLRAATPTAAAEMVTPDQFEWMGYFQNKESRLLLLIEQHLQHQHMRLTHKSETLTSPEYLVATYWQKLDYFSRCVQTAMQQQLTKKQHQLQALISILSTQHPRVLLVQVQMTLQRLESQYYQVAHKILKNCQQRFQAQLTTLNAVSPLATLDRGYALVTHQDHVILDSTAVHIGDELSIRFAKGRLTCEVLNVIEGAHHAELA